MKLLELLVEVQSVSDDLRARSRARHLRAVAGVQAALSHLRGVESVAQLLDRATAEVCRSCGFDRAVLFRVEDSRMVGASAHFADDPAWAASFLEQSIKDPPLLTHLLLETELIRRRAPVIVLDAPNDPRTFKPFVEASKTTSYVAAPIMPEGRVIGFLHADCYYQQRPIDAIDRETLWAFAEGFGYALERTTLAERLRDQREQVLRLLDRGDAISEGFADTEVTMATRSPVSDAAAAGPRSSAPVMLPRSRVENLLTRREIEVLALMAEGETNAGIAARLVISEGTVKSHVKHILRKLRAANRAEAVSRYLRLAQASAS